MEGFKFFKFAHLSGCRGRGWSTEMVIVWTDTEADAAAAADLLQTAGGSSRPPPLLSPSSLVRLQRSPHHEVAAQLQRRIVNAGKYRKPYDFKCMKIQMLNSMHAFLTRFEGITQFYHSCPRSTSSWLHSPARQCLVSTMGGCLLPPWRPFVVKFCTAESGTVCTVPALHSSVYSAHTLPPASVSSLQTYSQYSPFIPLHLYPVAKQCPPHRVTMGTLGLATTKYNFASANMMCWYNVTLGSTMIT